MGKTRKKINAIIYRFFIINTCMDILFLFILIFKTEGSFDLMILFHSNTYKLQRLLICQSNTCKEASWFKNKFEFFVMTIKIYDNIFIDRI